ncbi:hypothetical protein TPB0596_46040 [Tsukamurella pulmonis]|nr:hypothetical protein TPB0596_46040 [Tsukamurella pulmonis]
MTARVVNSRTPDFGAAGTGVDMVYPFSGDAAGSAERENPRSKQAIVRRERARSCDEVTSRRVDGCDSEW